jgi:hypothetical protein
MTFFDVSTDYQKKKALLAIAGLLVILATAFLSTWSFAMLMLAAGANPDPGLVRIVGICSVMFIGGIMMFAVVLSQHMVHEISIKVTNAQ